MPVRPHFSVSTVDSTAARPRRRGAPLLLASALWLSMAAFGTSAAMAAAPEAAFEAASQQFTVAQAGDGAAIADALERFRALSQAEPGNPVLLAYTGAATAMQARTTVLPWKKMSYAEDGLAQIDKALAMLGPADDAPLQRGTPGSLETRFIAASTFLSMPSMFHRGARGAALLAEVQASPVFAGSPAGFQGVVLLRAADHAIEERRPDDARRLLQQVVDRGMPQAAAARERLAKLAQ